MFPPVVFEETFTLKQLAAYLGCNYHAARRLLIKHGGYRTIGNGNPDYETRVVPISQALTIKEAITKGGRQ